MPSPSGIVLEVPYVDALLTSDKRVRSVRNEALLSLLVYGSGWIPSRYSPRTEEADKLLQRLNSERLLNMIPTEVRNTEEHAVCELMKREEDAREREQAQPADIEPEAVTDWRFLGRHWKSITGLIEPFIDSHYENIWRQKVSSLNLETLRELGFTDNAFYPLANDLTQHLELSESEESHRVEMLAEYDLSRLKSMHEEELPAIAKDYKIDPSRFKTRKSLAGKTKTAILEGAQRIFDEDRNRLRYAIAAVETREMLKWSATNSAVVKMRLPGTLSAATKQAAETNENSYQVYRIVLEEVAGFPRVESIDDVLRLRDDRRIAAFRDLVMEWAQILRYGDGRYAELLRRDIGKANRDLKKIKSWEQTSALAIFLAFPLWAIDKLAGTPFSDILMFVSGIYEIRSRMLQKQNEWILLGR